MEEESWIHHGPRESRPAAVSLGEYFMECLSKYSSRVAQVQKVDGRIESRTFSDLLHRGKRVAVFLRERGVVCGDTVWVSSGNNLAVTPVILGTTFIGAALAPVLHLNDEDSMLHMLGVIQPRLVISNQHAWPALSAALTKLGRDIPLIALDTVVENMEQAEEAADFTLAHIADPATHVALVMSSSGTSGNPKGVEISHKAFILQAYVPLYGPLDKDSPNQKVLMNLSYPHWITTHSINLMMLAYGLKVVLIAEFSVEEFLEMVQECRVNSSILKPPEVAALARSSLPQLYDTSSLQSFICGGAIVDTKIREMAEQKLKAKIHLVYGTTEIMATFNPLFGNTEEGRDSFGTVSSNVDLKIVDVTSGRALGPNCEGELLVRSPSLMNGYRNDPVETRKVMDDEGFYHTGDLVRVDEQGYFYFVDRIKERIRYIIYQFSASDVEAVLSSHPDVVDAAVVGVPHETDTDHAVGFIVRRAGSTVTAGQLAALVRGAALVQVAPRRDILPRRPPEVGQWEATQAQASRRLGREKAPDWLAASTNRNRPVNTVHALRRRVPSNTVINTTMYKLNALLTQTINTVPISTCCH